MKICITGGAGFIGSHLVRWFVKKYPNYQIFNLDKLTYAGNLENLKDIEQANNYQFIKGDIADKDFIFKLFDDLKFDAIINLAAESHVDRSILDPTEFIRTNINGTAILLEASRINWANDQEKKLFYQVSTDEVFGSLPEKGFFTENSPYDPRSPYAASKAAADHLVRSYFHTFQLPCVISNCSNNFGPNQYPEKLIPLIIQNIKNNMELPIYGKGLNVRDWLFVEDHAKAIDVIFHKGKIGETYCISARNEWRNIDLVEKLCDIMDRKLERAIGTSRKLITYVKDRAGHDKRYAIDPKKLENELGWEPDTSFETDLGKTINWYLENQEWLEHVTSGIYQNYYTQQYHQR